MGVGQGQESEGKGSKVSYPDIEVEILVGDGFDVEAYCGYSGDDFADLEASNMSAFGSHGWDGSRGGSVGVPLTYRGVLFSQRCPRGVPLSTSGFSYGFEDWTPY